MVGLLHAFDTKLRGMVHPRRPSLRTRAEAPFDKRGRCYKRSKKISDAYALAGVPKAFEYAFYEYYQDPQNRKYDDVDAPPDCVGDDEFLVWANCDAEKHYFKGEITIPWINKHCK